MGRAKYAAHGIRRPPREGISCYEAYLAHAKCYTLGTLHEGSSRAVPCSPLCGSTKSERSLYTLHMFAS
eukprot:365436-Chlamydomonas_euryale.AAC.1